MFDDALHFLVETQEAPDWERLGQNLPYEWIEQAVAYTGRASIRQRRLPAEQVVWLVVALALYRHQSIGEIVDDPRCSSTVCQQERRCPSPPTAGFGPLEGSF